MCSINRRYCVFYQHRGLHALSTYKEVCSCALQIELVTYTVCVHISRGTKMSVLSLD